MSLVSGLYFRNYKSAVKIEIPTKLYTTFLITTITVGILIEIPHIRYNKVSDDISIETAQSVLSTNSEQKWQKRKLDAIKDAQIKNKQAKLGKSDSKIENMINIKQEIIDSATSNADEIF